MNDAAMQRSRTTASGEGLRRAGSQSGQPLLATMTAARKSRVSRLGWLRAAVLGANDGILSTGSLIVGVASAAAAHAHIVLAGTAGLVAGAMSMAAGEFVSVSSQAD